jgi:ABC-type transport system substrate-binding protein
MSPRAYFPLAALACVVLLAACAMPTSPGASTGASEPGPVARKSMTAVMMSAPAQLAAGNLHVASTPTWQGGDELEELVNAGLTTADQNGRRLPLLAEAVPTVENGLWKVFPDRTMETTWRIQNRARWHDGTPFTPGSPLHRRAVSGG